MNRLLPIAAVSLMSLVVPRPAAADASPVPEEAFVAAARRLEGAVVTIRRDRTATAWVVAARRALTAAEAPLRSLANDPAKVDSWTLYDRSGAAGGTRAFFVGEGLLLTTSSAVDGTGKVEVVASDGRTAEAVVSGIDRDFGLALLKTSMTGTVLEVDGGSELEPGRLLLTPTAPDGGVELAVVPSRETGTQGRGLARLPRGAEGGAVGSPALGPDGRVRGLLVSAGRSSSTYATSSAQRAPLVYALQGDHVEVQGGQLHYTPVWPSAGAATHVLPARRIARALDDLRRDGRVGKAYLGVVLGAAEAEGKPIDERRVARLLPESPAEGQLKAGDRIVGVAGRRLEAHDDLSYEILALTPGKPATLSVERALQDGRGPIDVTVTPAARNDDANARGSAVFGFEAMSLTPELKAWLRVEEDGLVVSEVTGGGAAERGGLRRGDRLVRVMARDVATPADLGAAVDDALRRLAAGEVVTVGVVREGKALTLRLLGGGDAPVDVPAPPRGPAGAVPPAPPRPPADPRPAPTAPGTR